jgi:hypothetical protein
MSVDSSTKKQRSGSARRFSPRARRAVALASWLAVSSSFACSYYSEDLLKGINQADGGAGSSNMSGGAGGKGGTGSPIGGGAAAGTLSSIGGAGAVAGSSSPVAGAGGGADNAGGAPDMTSAGAGGEASADACPDDANKLEPGTCGCGVPETCAELEAALAHRYNFDKAGMVAVDSIGDADGTIVGVSASKGTVVFDGTTVAYVDLPNGIISSLKDASFEIWLTWGGGNTWQRIFDFGTNDLGEGNQGEGTTYLYLTPRDGATGNVLRASFSLNGVGSETTVRTSATLPTSSVQHLVLVVDDTNNELRLYLNGSVAALSGYTQSLSSLKDVNNWLGRSNFKDTPLKGSIDEFRIYKTALTAAQVAASYSFGPSPTFL